MNKTNLSRRAVRWFERRDFRELSTLTERQTLTSPEDLLAARIIICHKILEMLRPRCDWEPLVWTKLFNCDSPVRTGEMFTEQNSPERLKSSRDDSWVKSQLYRSAHIYRRQWDTLKWDTMCMELYCSPESAGQFGPSADPAASVTRTSRVINCIGIVHEKFWLDLDAKKVEPELLQDALAETVGAQINRSLWDRLMMGYLYHESVTPFLRCRTIDIYGVETLFLCTLMYLGIRKATAISSKAVVHADSPIVRSKFIQESLGIVSCIPVSSDEGRTVRVLHINLVYLRCSGSSWDSVPGQYGKGL
ncbi:hypothetical protein WN51_07939 [Melipona quadrifasciata]|uniref:Uncharacterized protein n=1 Tax=Melipona quadrifasciata TaxID=166423 RepID=A0A0M8ZRC4_9HYME|nr:hypothetical protein WN51_07939 [Melipona quadrifasciata]